MMGGRRAVIRASEVGQYAYCSRAWWLERVRGVRAEHADRLEAGRELHAAHGRGVWLGRWLVRAGVIALACGGGLLFLWSLLTR